MVEDVLQRKGGLWSERGGRRNWGENRRPGERKKFKRSALRFRTHNNRRRETKMRKRISLEERSTLRIAFRR